MPHQDFHATALARRLAFALAAGALLACGGSESSGDGEANGRVTVDSGALAPTATGDSARPALADTALTPSQTTASAGAVPQPGVTTQPGPGAPSTVGTSTTPAAGPGSAVPAAAPVDSPATNAPTAALATTPEPATAATPSPSAPARRAVPFGVGERFSYDVKIGPLRVGSGSMRVLGVESIRGVQAWHTSFTVKGSALGVKVDDLYESWFDVVSLSSLRHLQDVDEGPYERRRTFEIFPDRKVYVEQVEGKQPREGVSVDHPLDDGSFIYFIRSLPELEVGKTYSFNNYFRPDRNPVKVTVVRRERVEVPAGKFNALVLRPSIKTKGMFAEGSAEVWLSDDPARMLLQLKSKLPFGTLNLYLRSYDLHTER